MEAPAADEGADDGLFRVPHDEQFEGAESIEAPEIEEIADELIREYEGDFPRHANARIVYRWKMKGGSKDGGALLGLTQRTHWLARHHDESEFTVWVAADNCRLMRLTPRQMRALVFDLLFRIEYSEDKDKFKIRDADIITFRRTVEVMGPWTPALERARKAFAQAPLPLGFPRDAERDEAADEADESDDA